MARRDSDFYPVFPMNFMIVVLNFISVFCAVSRIWFCVYNNAHTTRRKLFLHDHKLTKTQTRNGVGVISSINILYLYQWIQWQKRIATGIIGVCLNIWCWFRMRIKSWTRLIGGVLYSDMWISNVWNSMMTNDGWRSSLKVQTPHTLPSTTHKLKSSKK